MQRVWLRVIWSPVLPSPVRSSPPFHSSSLLNSGGFKRTLQGASCFHSKHQIKVGSLGQGSYGLKFCSALVGELHLCFALFLILNQFLIHASNFSCSLLIANAQYFSYIRIQSIFVHYPKSLYSHCFSGENVY